MKKEIKDIRKSINERKKLRGIPTKSKTNSVSTIMPSLPQDEERHGFYPNFIDTTSASNSTRSNAITGTILKGIFSIMLFFSIAIIWQNDAEFLDVPKEWTSSVLTEEFPFASVYKWYKDSFGTPLAFSPNNTEEVEEAALVLPVSGNVIETFQANGKGIMIAPQETTSVAALREGVVLFAGKKQDTDKTVVIQHADGSTSTYGFLSSIDVHLYQVVDSKQRLGEFTPSNENEMVYFAIEKDNAYVDPVQVIEVDDNP